MTKLWSARSKKSLRLRFVGPCLLSHLFQNTVTEKNDLLSYWFKESIVSFVFHQDFFPRIGAEVSDYQGILASTHCGAERRVFMHA
jgi:hypothetical protein